MRYRYLTEYITDTKSKTIIEIGTWNGDNSKKMITSAIAASNLLPEEITYYGFDVWEQMDQELFTLEKSKWPPTRKAVEASLKASGANIHLIQGNTKDTLPEFVGTAKEIDFIFIDGGHSFETIKSDWNNLQKIINEHTVVLFDDYYQYTDGTDITDGCNNVIDNLNRDIWDVNILPEFDQFGHMQVFFVSVNKKS